MDDVSRQPGAERDDSPASELSEDATEPDHDNRSPAFQESLVDELGALIDDGRTYAQAELAFQKTRAKLAGKAIGVAAASVVVAINLLHIAFLALAVGMVMALEPLVTIWGAIAIVVGVLLISVGLLLWIALGNAKKLSALFSSEDNSEGT